MLTSNATAVKDKKTKKLLASAADFGTTLNLNMIANSIATDKILPLFNPKHMFEINSDEPTPYAWNNLYYFKNRDIIFRYNDVLYYVKLLGKDSSAYRVIACAFTTVDLLPLKERKLYLSLGFGYDVSASFLESMDIVFTDTFVKIISVTGISCVESKLVPVTEIKEPRMEKIKYFTKHVIYTLQQIASGNCNVVYCTDL